MDTHAQRTRDQLRLTEIIDALDAGTPISAPILGLKTQRNALAAISMLPTEVLQEIFLQAVMSDSAQSLVCATVSHVCRSWREMALGYPRLWTHLPMECPLWMPEMLVRSRNAPLRVEACTPWAYSALTEAFAERPDYMARIEHLRLSSEVGCATMHCILNTLASCKAPILRSLYLGAESDYLPWRTDFPSDFAPQLQSLHISGFGLCFVSWKPATPLVHLTALYFDDKMGLLRLTLSQLLTLLDAAPRLETLRLQGFRPSSGHDTLWPHALRPVHLTSLRTLEVTDITVCAWSILSDYIRWFPQHTALRITFIPKHNGTVPNAARTLAPIAPYIEALPDDIVLRLDGDLCEHSGVTIHNQLQPGTSRFWLHVDHFRTEAHACSFLKRFAVPFNSGKGSIHLLLHHVDFTRRGTWTTVLRMAAVTKLTAYLSSAFLRALLPRSDGSTLAIDDTLFWPRLEHLTLFKGNVYNVQYWSMQPSWFDIVLNWLTRRQRHGMGIKRIHLDPLSALSADDILRLQQVVPEVYVMPPGSLQSCSPEKCNHSLRRPII